MSLFQWSEELATGMTGIDEQHQELVSRINAFLQHCIKTDSSREKVMRAFEFLRVYAFEHWNTEEKLMEEYGYPYRQTHMQEHANFRQWVKETASNISNIDLNSSFMINVNCHLVVYLEDHLRTLDRRMTDYFKHYANNHNTPHLLEMIQGTFMREDSARRSSG